MFPERVKSVTLDKARINFACQPSMADEHEYFQVDTNLLVEDFAFDCGTSLSPYLPDYAIKGYFKVNPDMSNPIFFIQENGPHFMYITGIPRNLPEGEKQKFRFKNTEFISYWEDRHAGYLFQVISRESALTNLLSINK